MRSLPRADLTAPASQSGYPRILPPRQFVRLFDDRYYNARGVRAQHAAIAFLPGVLGAHLPTLSTSVLLGVDYARKILNKHGLKYEDLQVVEDLIGNSVCIREKTRHLTLMGYSEHRGGPFSVVLKVNRNGDEVWLATLHRIKDAQMKSKVGRYPVLRTLASDFEE